MLHTPWLESLKTRFTPRRHKTRRRSQRQRSHIARAERLEARTLLTVLFADSFEQGEWNGKWVEDSQNDWFDSTQRATDGSFSAEVDGRATDATLTMTSPIDLSGMTSPELTFDWLIENGFDSGEYLALDVSSNGGSTWQNDVRRLDGNVDAENSWHGETVDLSPYASSNLLIRFRSKVSRANEDANVDNVQMTAEEIASNSFSVVMLPDTQFYSQSYPNQFNGQTQWIADHAASDNLVFVSHVGDVVQNGGGTVADNFNELEWNRADSAMSILDGDLVADPDGLIPYSVSPGNHDYDVVDDKSSGVDRFTDFFGATRYSGRSWYGGQSADESNYSQIFSAEGQDYLHIGLDWSPDSADIAWAQSVIDANPDRAVILATHNYLGTSGRNAVGEQLFQDLVSPNPQIFMVLSGHISGEYHQVSQNQLGLDVVEILADFQTRPNGGDGWMRLMEFLPDLDRIDVETYSPTLDQFETDGDSQFSIGIDFDQRFDFASPRFVIDDVVQVEGGEGTSTEFIFTVTRHVDTTATSTIDWQTNDGTAIAGSDYMSGSGQLVFATGESEQTISITVLGDDVEEANEQFFVTLSNPIGGLIGEGEGSGTIINDESSIAIGDAVVTEGDGKIEFIDAFVAAGIGGLDGANSMTIGPDGHLYVAGLNSDSILRYDASTGEARPAAGNGGADFVASGIGGLDGPFGLAFGPDQHLYVSSSQTDSVLRYDGITGQFIDEFVPAGSGDLQSPRGLIFSDGMLYVASVDSDGSTQGTGDAILRYDDVTGAFVDTFVGPGSGGLDNPTRLTIGPDGNFYVSSTSSNSNAVLRFDVNGDFVDDFVAPGSGGLDGPADLLFATDGLLYVSSARSDEVLRYDANNGAFVDAVVSTASGGLDSPIDLLFDADGNLIVSSQNTDEILRYGAVSQAAFNVSLTSPTAHSVSVDFWVVDGTATAGSDYSAAGGTMTFDPGVTSRTILVPTLDDSLMEGDETFVVNLSNAVGGDIVDGQGQATIIDDDGEVFPNDPLFGDQWALNNTGQTGGLWDSDMDLPAAWSVATGTMATTAAVLDNGVDYTHEDLYLNIWLNEAEIPAGISANLVDADSDRLITFRDLNDVANAALVTDLNGTGYIDGGDLLTDSSWEDGIDTDGNGYVDDLIGWDVFDNDNDPMPGTTGPLGHGTRMAGIIGAMGDNAVGITGINWQVQLMAVRIRFDPSVVSHAITGINYAVDNNAVASWLGVKVFDFDQGLYDAIDAGRLQDHLFVAPSGKSTDPDLGYPTLFDLDNIIAVAAVDENDETPTYSNYDPVSIDLAASTKSDTGIGILATYPGDMYQHGGGNSSSSAHVAGVATLLRSLHPEWTYAQVRDQILSTVDPLPSLTGKTVTGGRLNAAAALATSSIHVTDPVLVEGDSGTTQLIFTVSRRGDTSQPLTLNWVTEDGTATAASGDYVAASGQVGFAVAETEQTVTILVNGDTAQEADETMFLNLSVASGATTIADATSQAVIQNDDTGIAVIGVAPNSASPNQQLTVTVSGSNFVNGATVDFGTRVNVQSVTFVSSSQLDVLIKVHRRAAEGSRDVTVTNPDSSSATLIDGFNVTAGLFAETTGDGGDVILLTQADAEAFAAYALQLWTDAIGVTPTATLQATVADLPGNLLGSTNGHTITLDVDAAGIGWFIDSTPGDNVEFDPALGNNAALGHYDLLTAAAHEVGHLLGFEHNGDHNGDHNDVMADTLAIGTRRLPALEPDPVPAALDDAGTFFVFETPDADTDDDDPDPIIAQPLYADGYHAIEDSVDDDALKTTQDTPIVFVPDDDDDFDPDALFVDFDGSLLDELLAV